MRVVPSTWTLKLLHRRSGCGGVANALGNVEDTKKFQKMVDPYGFKCISGGDILP